MSRRYYVPKCSSCGGEHGIELNQLVTPAIIGDQPHEYVTQCPKTKKALYVRSLFGSKFFKKGEEEIVFLKI